MVKKPLFLTDGKEKNRPLKVVEKPLNLIETIEKKTKELNNKKSYNLGRSWRKQKDY